jgi:cell division protein FtsI/penicillin-binding protein 2
VTSAVANGGTVYDPHVVKAIVPHVDNDNTGASAPSNLALPSGLPDCGAFSGLPCNVPTQTYGTAFSGDTATKLRAAMWDVTSYGTGVLYRSGVALADQPIKIGGKTGTGENGNGGIATTWWISMAQDDQAPGGGPAQVVFVQEKDKAGEGACQVYVAYDTFEAARQLNYLKT